jgi:acyl dehydratase
LTVRANVLEKRASRTRPEMGFIGFLFEVTNQAGEVVMTLASTLMVARRNSDALRLTCRPRERGDP